MTNRLKFLFCVFAILLASGAMLAQSGYCIDFQNSAFVDVAESAWQPSTQFSVGAWIYPTAFSPGGSWTNTIFCRTGSSSHGLILRCGGNGQISFLVGQSGWNNPLAESAEGVLQLNTWQHVAGTYDDSFIRIYVNGVVVAEESWPGVVYQADNQSAIGKDSYFDRYFLGYIDEVVVYTRALSGAEVTGLMNNVFPLNNREHLFLFNEGSGTDTMDQQLSQDAPISGTFAWVEITETLPVELSIFSATMTSEGYATINWVAQSETNLMGYYVLKSGSSQLSESSMVSALIEAGNLSTEQQYSFIDSEVSVGTWFYWLQANDLDGGVRYYGPVHLTINDIPGEPEVPTVPLSTGLVSIYPNPFNPLARISYRLEEPANAEIKIFSQRGQLLKTFTRSHAEAGLFTIVWDGRDESGTDMSSGVYLCQFRSGNRVTAQKMILLK